MNFTIKFLGEEQGSGYDSRMGRPEYGTWTSLKSLKNAIIQAGLRVAEMQKSLSKGVERKELDIIDSRWRQSLEGERSNWKIEETKRMPLKTVIATEPLNSTAYNISQLRQLVT